MLNHRRPAHHRPRDAASGDHDEQVALLDPGAGLNPGNIQHLSGSQQPGDNRWSASTSLAMDSLAGYPSARGNGAPHGGQLTARFQASSDISPSSSINFYNSSTSSSRQNFIYYSVQPGDTLQNLSVKYSCPVASIKRMNNLWSDQEFHALTRIKLPVGKFNLIENVLEEEEAEALKCRPSDTFSASLSNSSSSPLHRQQFIGDNRLSGDPIPLNTVNQSNLPQPPPAGVLEGTRESVFKELDLNIEKAKSAAQHYDNHANDILQSLVDSGNIVDELEQEDEAVLMARQQAESLLNDMTEFGMTYTGLILFIFIVCLILPLGYVIYLEETHHAARHETNKVD